MPTYYHNEILFSEIYLEEITRQAENADVLASLKVLGEYREYANTHNLKAWKESYVHEVLSALGFFAQAKNDHLTHLFSMGSDGKENPLSLCFVILPDENLDNTTIGRNWAEKVIRALRENNLQWGLLTNGKQWRIYHQDEPTPYETYLEIDLEAILKEKAKEAYQIFHKFMKAENFAVQEDSKCQFDRFKKESQDKIDYIEKELANALKQREEGGKGVLSDLCMGYVEELRQRKEGDLDDEGLRRKIYHGAMLYMFRLLFLFYADARRLLSDENHELLAKVEGECRARHDGDNLSTPDIQIWDSLEHIFVDIDQTYNGGLFSPQESEFTRFLSDTRIGDSYLENVIFNLTTYKEKNGQEKPISYRDMSVRHLGTLYEGLLEHKLFIAKENTEVKVAKGAIQFIPASQGGKLVVGHYLTSGSVYFAGDPSERKSTGSYYTPEYIVDYIVRNTVGEKLKELKDVFQQEQHSTMDAYQSSVDGDERSALRNLLEENSIAFVREKVLEISVLDPAMGSGHFLVNATNLISNFISGLLNEIGIEGSLESSTGYWRRWVVENCIYGVDLNPLAVELAKLSLWILSMEKNQPLSFMNHHLKCGNSLVGAKLEEIGNYPFSTVKKEIRQLNLFERDPDFKAAVEEVIIKSRQIAGKTSANLDDVREKKVWVEEIEQILEGCKAICDIHTSLYFRNTIDESQYDKMVQKRDFNFAKSIKIPNQYFHWEMEFPQILLRNKGFDCIIGNPPYGIISNENLKKSLLTDFSDQVNEIPSDSYVLFLIATSARLGESGTQSFIVPTTWLYMSSFLMFRRKFLTQHKLHSLTVFKKSVFPGVTVETCIVTLMNQLPGSQDATIVFEVTSVPEEFIGKKTIINTSQSLIRSDSNLSLLSSTEIKSSLFEKISKNNKQLKELTTIVCGLTPYRVGKGKPPQTEEIVKNRSFDASHQVDSSYRQYIMGRDFHRFRWQISEQRWLKYGSWLAEPRYAAPFDEPRKIVIRQTADCIIAQIDENQLISLKNVHNLKINNNGISYEYLVGLLNSKIINWWYQQLIPEKGRVFAEVKVVNLGKLPIREIDSTSPTEIRLCSRIHELVILIFNHYKQNPVNPPEDAIDCYKEEIDQLFYQLYGLTNDEIDIIESEGL